MARPIPREFDIAVLGSTGFTGRLVLKELVSQIRESPRHSSLRYPLSLAAGGRSLPRVRQFMEHVGLSEGPNPGPSGDASRGTADITAVEVDVQDPESIGAFCRSARLVLDCVGPYRFYGRPVVAACVAAGTDYLDISGEPEFMERMVLEFGEAAEQAGALIISACGFDSVPADLGLQAALHVLAGARPLPPGAQASVSSYLTVIAPLGAKGHYGTWESLVYGLASVGELRQMRKKVTKSSEAGKQVSGVKKEKKGSRGYLSFLPKHVPAVNAWVLPFPGSDVAVARRSLAHASRQRAASASQQGSSSGDIIKEPLLSGLDGASTSGASLGHPLAASAYDSVRYSAYFTLKSALEAYLFLAWGGLLSIMAQFKATRNLLLKYPEVFSFGGFSREGPSPEQMEATSFQMRFEAERTDAEARAGGGRRATLVVHGPELGYVVTPWIMVQAGLTLLGSRASLPRGGVLTPAVSFAGTDLQRRLQDRGMRFETLPTP